MAANRTAGLVGVEGGTKAQFYSNHQHSLLDWSGFVLIFCYYFNIILSSA